MYLGLTLAVDVELIFLCDEIYDMDLVSEQNTQPVSTYIAQGHSTDIYTSLNDLHWRR